MSCIDYEAAGRIKPISFGRIGAAILVCRGSAPLQAASVTCVGVRGAEAMVDIGQIFAAVDAVKSVAAMLGVIDSSGGSHPLPIFSKSVFTTSKGRTR